MSTSLWIRSSRSSGPSTALQALPGPSHLAASPSGPFHLLDTLVLKKCFFADPGALPLCHVHIHSPRPALWSPSGLTEDLLHNTVPDSEVTAANAPGPLGCFRLVGPSPVSSTCHWMCPPPQTLGAPCVFSLHPVGPLRAKKDSPYCTARRMPRTRERKLWKDWKMLVISSIAALIPGWPAYRPLPTASPSS